MSTCFALDLDGTLLSCRERHVAAARAALGGTPFDEAAFWAAKRGGATTRSAFDAQGLPADAAPRWTEIVETAAMLDLDEVFPDVPEAIGALHSAKLRPVVLTARTSGEALAAQLRKLGLDRVLGDIRRVSPKLAAQEKGELLKELRPLAFVGDTESDLEAAERAGTRFLAVSTGMRDAGFLRAKGAEVHETLTAAVKAALAMR